MPFRKAAVQELVDRGIDIESELRGLGYSAARARKVSNGLICGLGA